MTTATEPPAPAADAVPEQYVMLHTAGSAYAVPIARVQEIIRVPAITSVPRAAHDVEGVINLRGRILPVVNLSTRLGRLPTEASRTARIVVVEGALGSIGLLVEGVSEVLQLNDEEIAPASELAAEDQQLLLGIARAGEQLILLLDLDATLASGC